MQCVVTVATGFINGWFDTHLHRNGIRPQSFITYAYRSRDQVRCVSSISDSKPLFSQDRGHNSRRTQHRLQINGSTRSSGPSSRTEISPLLRHHLYLGLAEVPRRNSQRKCRVRWTARAFLVYHLESKLFTTALSITPPPASQKGHVTPSWKSRARREAGRYHTWI